MKRLSTKSLSLITVGSIFAWAFILHAGWQAPTPMPIVEPTFDVHPVTETEVGVTEMEYLTQMTDWANELASQALVLIDVTNQLGNDLHALSQTRYLEQLNEQLIDLQQALNSFPLYSIDRLSPTCLASYEAFTEAKIAYESAIHLIHTTVEYSLLRLDASALKATLSSSADQLLNVMTHLEQGIFLLQL